MEKCSRSNSPAAYSTSITAARRGTSSPIGPGSSCPLACATGLTGSDQRDLVLGVPATRVQTLSVQEMFVLYQQHGFEVGLTVKQPAGLQDGEIAFVTELNVAA